jgi:hypothetical protein
MAGPTIVDGLARRGGRAVSSAASSKASGRTTRLTSRHECASPAVMVRPAANISIARERPINRGKRCVPPKPVMMPSVPPGWPKIASVAAMRM